MKRRYQYLHPFSHERGACCLIPKTSYVVQAFPAKIFIFSLEDLKGAIKEIEVNADRVTLQQDLESLCVHVFSDQFSFYINQNLEVHRKRPKRDARLERLCFGVTKKQEMERIYARADLKEIFPIWFRLGQLVDLPPLEEKKGIFSLVDLCQQKILLKEEVIPSFLTLFRASFRSIFLPRTKDEEWQNLFPQVEVTSSALHLFQEGSRLIRQLFFLEKENQLHFLPYLPRKLAHGRAYDLKWQGGKLHVEWSKHKLRKVTLFVDASKEILFRLPADISFFRMCDRKKKVQHFVHTPLFLEKGIYILDRFNK